MMFARSKTMTKVARNLAKRRVSFKNDHPDLMKPRHTDKYIFTKNGVIYDYVHEKTEPVKKLRPRRLMFGKGRSLAELASGDGSKKVGRSIKVTTEKLNPDAILKNKTPACPLYTPNTTLSSSKEAWEKMEVRALNKACTAYNDILCKRTELIKILFNNPAGNRNSKIADKVTELTQRMMEIKNEIRDRKRNIESIRTFSM